MKRSEVYSLLPKAWSKFQDQIESQVGKHKRSSNAWIEWCTQADLRKFTVDNYPRGYPQFAALINADLHLQCSDVLNSSARSLLYKQDELVEMEAQLNELDATERRQVCLELRRRDSNDEERRSAVNWQGLIEYGMILSLTRLHYLYLSTLYMW